MTPREAFTRLPCMRGHCHLQGASEARIFAHPDIWVDMNDLPKPVDDGPKRSTNLTLRTKLVQEVRQFDINLSAAAKEGIERAAAKAHHQQWIERNRSTMASYDAFVEQKGLLLDDLRTF
jgi:antitoxin CcdA